MTSETFADCERSRAIAWKTSTTALPSEAKVAAPYFTKDGSTTGPSYDFCLPPDFAEFSLLPEVRERALRLFVELGIPWHAGVGEGPSNHLLSSQVQCVNALGQMVYDSERLVRAFGPVLGTTEVEEIEPGRWLTFEFIGSGDFLNEAVRGRRIRGSQCTSVDAAFIHRTHENRRELILVEWKYIEHYGRRKVDSAKDAIRLKRYGHLLADSVGPVNLDVLPFEELLQEPLYQLMRQQLLAHELEKAGAYDVERVRVVHVMPVGNLAYQTSVHGPLTSKLGTTVKDVWQRLLRRPDRFVSLDSAVFLDARITSDEYVNRYGNPATTCTAN